MSELNNYKVVNEYNSYTHEALEYLTEQHSKGKMTTPDYLRASVSLLDKTYGKNSISKQIKNHGGFRK